MKEFLRKTLPRQWFVSLKRIYRLPQSFIYFRPPVTYNQDGLVSRHSAAFMQEPRFHAAYDIASKVGKWTQKKQRLHWRVHVLCWAAQHALRLEGDFVECGVDTGGFSRAVIEYVQFQNEPRMFYLLDTYNGLVEEFLTSTEKKRAVTRKNIPYAETYEYTKGVFKDFANVRLVRGPVPDTLTQVPSTKVAYLSIDMNNVVPEIAAAEFFWDKLVSGAIIVLDDYGWQSHIEQKEAFDQFAAQRGLTVLSLPTGQGIIIKP